MYTLKLQDDTHLPKIHDDLVALGVAAVISMFLPIININIGNTANEEFEFAFIEDVH